MNYFDLLFGCSTFRLSRLISPNVKHTEKLFLTNVFVITACLHVITALCEQKLS